MAAVGWMVPDAPGKKVPSNVLIEGKESDAQIPEIVAETAPLPCMRALGHYTSDLRLQWVGHTMVG